MSSVTFKNLTKMYPVFPSGYAAAYKINLEIADGELYAFYGEESTGKSTFLRIIAGLEDITEGELLIGGKAVNDISVKDRNVALITADYMLKKGKTVYENLAYGLKIRGAGKEEIEEKVKKTAKLIGLENKLLSKVNSLTKMEGFLLAFGRAAAREPAVILFDEPLKNLSENDRQETLKLIKALHEKIKTTFIYATEDMAEAEFLAKRIAVIDFGSIAEIKENG